MIVFCQYYGRMRWLSALILHFTCILVMVNPVFSSPPQPDDRGPKCSIEKEVAQRVVWAGSETVMTLQDIASYCAPIIWFSPDEPLLGPDRGKDIRLPYSFPFQPVSNAPVVYYRIDDVTLRSKESKAILSYSDGSRDMTSIDMSKVAALNIRYCLYYPFEIGLGGHRHDLEVVDVKVFVLKWERQSDTQNNQCEYGMSVYSVVGRAHGLLWYDNNLIVDKWTKFPIGILVEEGKHANCPDKNLDGAYTPSYDVNKRINDAWGVRDIIREGKLLTSSFKSWMNKVRLEEDRVFPPLPEDSRLRQFHTVDGEYAPNNAVYELRPLPSGEMVFDDPKLRTYIESKGDSSWPTERFDNSIKKFGKFLDDDGFVKSASVSFRYDGNSGIAWSFPFFVFAHFENPISGGWFVQHMYLKDKNLRDFGWTTTYTSSASRWIDNYLSAGVEWDVSDTLTDSGELAKVTHHRFVLEAGKKLRINIKYTPLRFLAEVTDFWGLRFGIKYSGNAWDFNNVGIVCEIGAGAF